MVELSGTLFADGLLGVPVEVLTEKKEMGSCASRKIEFATGTLVGLWIRFFVEHHFPCI